MSTTIWFVILKQIEEWEAFQVTICIVIRGRLGGWGVWKFLLEKVGCYGKMEGVSRNAGLPYFIEVFLEIPHDATQENNLNVFIFQGLN